MIVSVRLETDDFVPNQNETLVKNAASWVEHKYGNGFEFNRVETGHWYKTAKTWHFVKGQIIFTKH